MKSATDSIKGDEKANEFAALTPIFRAESALEIASEIRDRLEQFHCLAIVISEHLVPNIEEGECASPVYRLSQLLDESMIDFSQMYRLLDCLTASRDALAQEGCAA